MRLGDPRECGQVFLNAVFMEQVCKSPVQRGEPMLKLEVAPFLVCHGSTELKSTCEVIWRLESVKYVKNH